MDKMAPKERNERDFEAIFQTDAGVRALRHIMKLTNFHGVLVDVDPATFEINTQRLIYNAARRDIWLEIRKLFTREQLAKIENGENGDG